MTAQASVLKWLRKKEIKPKQLQTALNISASMASRIMDGSRGVSVWHLDRVAELLQIPLATLFSDPDLLSPPTSVDFAKVDPQNVKDPYAHAPTHPIPDDVFNELTQAAFAFHALSVQCAEWSHRLTDLAADHGREILGGRPSDTRAGTTRDARTGALVRPATTAGELDNSHAKGA